MKWSRSAGHTFRSCQRQWYFRHCLANGVAKDSVRREAYLLSKLQSIPQWRGNLVDDVIGTTVVRGLRQGYTPTLNRSLKYAMQRFDTQLASARAHRLREADFRPSAHKGTFAAFRSMEYNGEIDEEDVARAREEVTDALTALFKLDEVKALMKAGTQCISQRSLSFAIAGVSVQAIPDLIVFYTNRPPLILDWKVHAFGVFDAFQQLALYAMALTRGKPHKDFPAALAEVAVENIELVEVQLLNRVVRRYQATDEEIAQIEFDIADSAYNIRRVLNGRKPADIDVTELEGAYGPEYCGRCQYQKLCFKAAA